MEIYQMELSECNASESKVISAVVRRTRRGRL